MQILKIQYFACQLPYGTGTHHLKTMPPALHNENIVQRVNLEYVRSLLVCLFTVPPSVLLSNAGNYLTCIQGTVVFAGEVCKAPKYDFII